MRPTKERNFDTLQLNKIDSFTLCQHFLNIYKLYKIYSFFKSFTILYLNLIFCLFFYDEWKLHIFCYVTLVKLIFSQVAPIFFCFIAVNATRINLISRFVRYSYFFKYKLYFSQRKQPIKDSLKLFNFFQGTYINKIAKKNFPYKFWKSTRPYVWGVKIAQIV